MGLLDGALTGLGQSMTQIATQQINEDIETRRENRLREWQVEQAEIERAYRSEERIAGEEFASSEREAGQEFAADENEKNRALTIEKAMQKSSLTREEIIDLATKQAKEELTHARQNGLPGDFETFYKTAIKRITGKNDPVAPNPDDWASRVREGEEKPAKESKDKDVDFLSSLKSSASVDGPGKATKVDLVYNKWMDNAERDLKSLLSADINTRNGIIDSIFSDEKTTPKGNRLMHHLKLLQTVADKGTPEQQARAKKIFSDFNSNR